MSLKTVRFGDDGQAATREFVARLDRATPAWEEFVGGERLGALRRQMATLEAIDRQYGGQAVVELEGADELVASILSELAHFHDDLRFAQADEDLASIVLAVALWAIRHDVDIAVVEPVVNALAHRSDRARSREELAAVFGLMQGVIAHVAPRLSADLERSNPDRPWRPLHLNFAITAIRTEDPALINHAFDALDAALPDDRAGFYAEALALALSPGVAVEVRNQIEKRHLKWTQQG